MAGSDDYGVPRRAQARVKDKTEFLLLSLWESYEAIRAFAGEDLEQAVYDSKDKEFLLELESKVTHYEYESYNEREVAMD